MIDSERAFMQATRQQIVDYLRREHSATVKELASYLGLTSTGVRQHLTVLERDGLIAADEERGSVGRPALVYRLSEQGDALYPKQYDELGNVLIEELRTMAGPDVLQSLLRRVAMRLAEPYRERMAGLPTAGRVSEAVRVIEERGCLVDQEPDGEGGWLINQYTCPFPKVAQCNSGVCALDVEFVRQLVGADARLTKSLLRGDPSCSYRIRPGQPIPSQA
jgi:predicted ArsR family transcriptional regulator